MQVVDKQAFWSRVRIGRERVDTLAREVFCQTTLTVRGSVDADADLLAGLDFSIGGGGGGGDFDPTSGSYYGRRNPSPSREEKEKEQQSEECSSSRRRRRSFDAIGGGGIVRVHSILETASDLVSEREEGPLFSPSLS